MRESDDTMLRASPADSRREIQRPCVAESDAYMRRPPKTRGY